jgi:hypothetical protein
MFIALPAPPIGNLSLWLAAKDVYQGNHIRKGSVAKVEQSPSTVGWRVVKI